MKQRMVIIGGGRIGGAMQYILKAHRPLVWDIDPTKTNATDSCDILLKNAELIFICAPAAAHHDIAQQINTCAPIKAIVVSLAKGLGPKGDTVPEMLAQHLSGARIAMLAGPMMAEEIMVGKPSAALVASSNRAVQKHLVALFKTTTLHVAPSYDIDGVAWLSVLKNIFATVWGAGDALGLGSNAKGILISAIANHTETLLPLLNGKGTSFATVAGIGDLLCTLTSEHSRNRQYGVSLVTGEKKIEGEGAKSISYLKKRLGKKFSRFPLLVACEQLVMRKKNPKNIFDTLCTLDYMQ